MGRGRTDSCKHEGTEVVELQPVGVPVKVQYKTVDQARPNSVQRQRKKIMVVVEGHKEENIFFMLQVEINT